MAEEAQDWLNSASPGDLHHIACLRVPKSLLESLAFQNTRVMRERVAHHQYGMLLGVHALRGKLSMPPPPPPYR